MPTIKKKNKTEHQKTINPKKWAKDFNRQFSEEELEMDNKHVKNIQPH